MLENTLKPLALNPPLNITLISKVEDLYKLKDFFDRERTLGWDIETNVLKQFWHRKIRTVQFGNINEQYVVDLLGFDISSQGSYGKNLSPELRQFCDIVTPVLCTDNWEKAGVSLQFEYMNFYWNLGLRTCGFWDCSVVERCIWAGLHSLKDYDFYSMEQMVARYFGLQIDKSLQESFTLDELLTQEQIEYAALDTRIPFPLQSAQKLIVSGQTKETHGSNIFNRVPKEITGDNLEEICKIENDCIGSFVDMHLHGENIDRERWLKRIDRNTLKLKEVVSNLDTMFIPLVGVKEPPATEEQVIQAKQLWEESKKVSDDELALRKNKKVNPEPYEAYLVYKAQKVAEHKKVHTILKHSITKKYTEEFEKYEGQAAINYSSTDRLLEQLKKFPGLKNLPDTDDTTLEKYEGHKVIDLVREYRGLSKDIGTYGVQWVTEWMTKPCKEEGWISPYDHKLHSQFNQYDAETGRSSSEKPNGQNIPKDKDTRSCFIAYPGRKLITIDMSGAELCILAEESDEIVWIEAFNKKQDVHSICCEMALGTAYWLEIAESNCKYFSKNDAGEYNRFKCGCELHNEIRNSLKSTNFGLPYGIGPRKLSNQIKKSYTYTIELLGKHKRAFSKLWTYLEKSGKDSITLCKSFDMYGRRRLFRRPNWAIAKQKAAEDRKILEPSVKEIGNAFNAILGNIERQGKNHRIQSANATIIKLAMGSGSGYLWHVLPQYEAKLVKMVHDELVIDVPEEHAETVAKIAEECISRAAAVKMKKVKMRSEYHIENYWCK